MLQASYGDFHWSPPKGHLDGDETELEAAFRETEEEAGFSKEQLKVYDECKSELNYEVRGKPKKVVYWLSELIDPSAEVKLSKEHQALKWLNFQQAWDIAKYDDMRSALTVAEEFIQKNMPQLH